MATDKCIQCFSMVNLMLIIAVVVYVILQKTGVIEGGEDGEGGEEVEDPATLDE